MKKNIFDSKSELRVYHDLESMWSKHVKIFDHVPVTNVFSYDELKKNTTYKEFNHLLKSSFDFVIGSIEEETYGEPILIIEFDGVGNGYNSREGYTPNHSQKLALRKQKLDLKLKICEMIGLPMIIVSYPEVEKRESDLTILDGIIGQVLANRGFDQIFKSHEFGLSLHEEIKDLHPDEQQAIIDWHGDNLSVDMDMKWNPIARKVWELSSDLVQIASFNWVSGNGVFMEKDGYLIYQGFVRLNKDYQHLIHDGIETFDGTEEYIQGESFFEKLPKMIAKQADGILIRKKIKIRAIHCENVYIDELAEDLIHYLIFSDLTERWNLLKSANHKKKIN